MSNQSESTALIQALDIDEGQLIIQSARDKLAVKLKDLHEKRLTAQHLREEKRNINQFLNSFIYLCREYEELDQGQLKNFTEEELETLGDYMVESTKLFRRLLRTIQFAILIPALLFLYTTIFIDALFGILLVICVAFGALGMLAIEEETKLIIYSKTYRALNSKYREKGERYFPHEAFKKRLEDEKKREKEK